MTATIAAISPINVSATGAMLRGTANPDGVDAYAWFEYGLTTSYGAETTHVYVGAGSADVPISATIGGLSPGLTYHYRAALEPGAAPPPSGTFGTSLPTRLPASSGPQYYVSTSGNDTTGDGSIGNPWRTPQKALNTVPLSGSIINLRTGTYAHTGGTQLTWSRAGSSSNPVTMRNYPGETASLTFSGSGSQFLITGSYLKLFGEVTSTSSRLIITGSTVTSTTGIKASGGANNIDVDGLHIHGLGNMGVLLGGGGTAGGSYDVSDLQFYNCRINGIGDLIANQNHGMYFDSCQRVTVASCLIYDNFAFGLQMYPHNDSCIVTGCTIDDHPNAAPIVMEGDAAGRATNNRVVGCSLSIADSGSGFSAVMARFLGSGNIVEDCNGYNVATPCFKDVLTGTVINCASASTNPLYVNQATRDYHLQGGSPLIDLASARAAYLPAYDIAGNARVTADAGCYAA